jgi:endoglucanase
MSIRRIIYGLSLFLLLMGVAYAATPASTNDTLPEVTHISLAAPDILSLTIQAGHVLPSTLSVYVEQPGDMKIERDKQVILKRNGEEVGWLIGNLVKPGGKRDHLVTFEKLIGDPLLTTAADKPETYSVEGVTPIAVYRKSKPNDWAQPSKVLAMQHTVYLKMPSPLQAGHRYVITTTGLNLKQATLTFLCDSATVRSEAVHVNQIGYRPDDSPKRAFLSVWLGNGGACPFPEGLAFHLIDDKTGKVVFTGTVARILAADATETLRRAENFSKTSIYRMDFSSFKTPGMYHVTVDGIGSSYPFPIAPDVWDKAFRVQMRGLANERGGVNLAPPYADYTRPRDFYPADGVPVYQSTYSIMDGNPESPELAKRSTGQLVPDAWGGYHDAGDWNPRRVTHMRVTAAQLEMLKLFPEHFGKMLLPIPHTPAIPDVLTEALFELDCFRRLQKPDGGMPFGIETDGDPTEGEVSFLQSMPAYVYAPDLWSGYIYAGVAARAAKLLGVAAPDLAKTYQASALKAMEWAEKDWASRKAAGTLEKLRWEIKDDRNLTAVLLYDLTGDKRWHDVFLENTVLKEENANVFNWGVAVQKDAAFAYTQLPVKLADPALKVHAVAAICRQADAALEYAQGNAFNLTTPDRYRPMFLGFFSTPDAIDLCRAHFLTQKPQYLAGAVQATQFQSGCNPNNMTYTSGLGKNPPLHPLLLDTRRTGQPAPTGLTVYGNWDRNDMADFSEWVYTYFLNTACTPAPKDWPLTESYFDIFLFPSTNEFTVDLWDKNIYVWGYLAARK